MTSGLLYSCTNQLSSAVNVSSFIGNSLINYIHGFFVARVTEVIFQPNWYMHTQSAWFRFRNSAILLHNGKNRSTTSFFSEQNGFFEVRVIQYLFRNTDLFQILDGRLAIVIEQTHSIVWSYLVRLLDTLAKLRIKG